MQWLAQKRTYQVRTARDTISLLVFTLVAAVAIETVGRFKGPGHVTNYVVVYVHIIYNKDLQGTIRR